MNNNDAKIKSKMSTTRTLPTDKNGNVYYGPKTIKTAKTAINQITDDGRTTLAEALNKITSQLALAGYTGVAAKLRAYYA